jgi:hypothetical protein
MDFRWTNLNWGLLCHRSYFLRLLNPFLVFIYTPATWIIMFAGLLVALFQTRAFFPFVLLAMLTLDYKKLDKKIIIGCLFFSAASLLYYMHLSSSEMAEAPIYVPDMMSNAGLTCGS